jgi:hypothetical protein
MNNEKINWRFPHSWDFETFLHLEITKMPVTQQPLKQEKKTHLEY